MEYVTLNNGVKMPILGYGVYQTPPADTESCVSSAIKLGYRSIDTAQAYGNEEGVGNAIAGCGLPREELFITTKIWITNAGYEKAKASIDASLKKLRSDYIDLLLIHQPFGDYYGSYRAMEEAYKDGKGESHRLFKLLSRQISRYRPFCRGKARHKPDGNSCFPAAEAAEKLPWRYTPYVMGSLCRGQEQFLLHSRAGVYRRSA